VWGVVTDITRMGEWSPECTAGRWVNGSSGPAEGAEFEGDNVAKVAGRAVKKWTTTSKVTICEAPRRFAFLAEGYTTWTYVLEPSGNGTKVTESYAYTPSGFMGQVYDKVLARPKAMVKGMQQTLNRMKVSLESNV
jgi:Polyketide cyclase / dehydrase and lipid transport